MDAICSGVVTVPCSRRVLELIAGLVFGEVPWDETVGERGLRALCSRYPGIELLTSGAQVPSAMAFERLQKQLVAAKHFDRLDATDGDGLGYYTPRVRFESTGRVEWRPWVTPTEGDRYISFTFIGRNVEVAWNVGQRASTWMLRLFAWAELPVEGFVIEIPSVPE